MKTIEEILTDGCSGIACDECPFGHKKSSGDLVDQVCDWVYEVRTLHRRPIKGGD